MSDLAASGTEPPLSFGMYLTLHQHPSWCGCPRIVLPLNESPAQKIGTAPSLLYTAPKTNLHTSSLCAERQSHVNQV